MNTSAYLIEITEASVTVKKLLLIYLVDLDPVLHVNGVLVRPTQHHPHHQSNGHLAQHLFCNEEHNTGSMLYK